MSDDSNELLIDGRNLTKVFRDFWGRSKVTAVRDVSIALPRGTVCGLLGPNGAGKSTLMKMVLGHLYPTSGDLRVLGRDPRNVEAKQRLGYLPERSVFYRNLTAEETLRLFGDILGLAVQETQRRTEQLLEMVGLQTARNRKVGEFSHGMGRRLGLAQALLNDPDLILLDEPTAGMDPVGCFEVKTLITTLRGRGKTVLMSCHLLADVEDVCDTVMIMFGGVVQKQGRVADLLTQEDEVQIRAPKVSENLIREACALLGTETDADQVKVSHPVRSLEDYFLQIVRDAHDSRQETSGAQMSKGIAQYLQAEQDLQNPGKTAEDTEL